MVKRFRDRGYPEKMVNRAFIAASEVPRSILLQENVNKNKNRNNKYSLSSTNVPVFSTPYSSEFTKIRNIVTKYLPILINDPIYGEVLCGYQVGIPPTLGSSLSPSLFSNEQSRSNWLQFRGTSNVALKDVTIVVTSKRVNVYSPALMVELLTFHHSLIVTLNF